MLVEDVERWRDYRGLSPAFVERVWAKRRAEQKSRRLQNRIQLLKVKAERATTATVTEAKPLERRARDARHKHLRLQRFMQEAEASSAESAAFDRIANRICRALGVSRQDLLAFDRSLQACLARQAVCYWASRMTTLTLEQLSVRLGRDHTTVLHGRRVYPSKRAKMGRNLRPL